jgi:hypothetical protein
MSDLMAASRVNYQQIKSKTARRVMGALVLPVFLSACLGANVDQIVQRQCPSVAILNTADKLPLDGQTVELNAASLTCSIDRNQDNALLADVTLTGRVSEKSKCPFLSPLSILRTVNYRAPNLPLPDRAAFSTLLCRR